MNMGGNMGYGYTGQQQQMGGMHGNMGGMQEKKDMMPDFENMTEEDLQKVREGFTPEKA